MEKCKEFVKKYLPIHAIILFSLAIVSFIVAFIGARNQQFAEWISVYISSPVRRALAMLTSPIPFSLAEILLMSSPLILALIIFIGIKKKDNFIRYAVSVISIISLLYTGYVYTLGIGYHRVPIAEKMSLCSAEVDRETLDRTIRIVLTECESVIDEIEFLPSGASTTDMTLDGICQNVLSGYDKLSADIPSLGLEAFSSSAKPVIMSELMTKLEILGIYSYFTGESNINVHYPDYEIPFTVAHELAHQRGISRENEANFIAFLVCIRSESAFVRYSGYMNMFEYLASALVKTDREALQSVYEIADTRIIGELRAFNEFYYANKSEFLAELSDFVNDNYLKAQGTEGIVSYGLVVTLAVAYYSNS